MSEQAHARACSKGSREQAVNLVQVGRRGRRKVAEEWLTQDRDRNGPGQADLRRALWRRSRHPVRSRSMSRLALPTQPRPPVDLVLGSDCSKVPARAEKGSPV